MTLIIVENGTYVRHEAYREGTDVVLLDADVTHVFRDSTPAKRALRLLMDPARKRGSDGAEIVAMGRTLGEDAMSERTTVLLYEIGGLALIVPESTGILYRNQTGGHACLPSQMEGYLVPLAGGIPRPCERLLSHFTGPKWGGWCSERIDAETADEIDSVLAEILRQDQIVVDRTKLEMSWEAWVHVIIAGPLLALVEHAEPGEAILTWPNSD